MKSVSLVHIKRIGLSQWINRDWWEKQRVRIWSGEHGAWWRPNAEGYTCEDIDAWELDFSEAYVRTEHCGPEKKINYFAIPPAHRGDAA